MGLSKSIEQQLQRIEAAMEPKETPQERYQRECRESAERSWTKYFQTLDQVLGTMDEEFADLVYDEVVNNERDDICNIIYRQAGFWESDNCGPLSPLLAGVSRFATRFQNQHGCTEQFPCAMPASICRFLQEHGAEVFSHTVYEDKGTWTRALPKYAWLMGSLCCSVCYYPVPSKTCIDKWDLPRLVEAKDLVTVPFPECPVCGEAIKHKGYGG